MTRCLFHGIKRHQGTWLDCLWVEACVQRDVGISFMKGLSVTRGWYIWCKDPCQLDMEGEVQQCVDPWTKTRRGVADRHTGCDFLCSGSHHLHPSVVKWMRPRYNRCVQLEQDVSDTRGRWWEEGERLPDLSGGWAGDVWRLTLFT